MSTTLDGQTLFDRQQIEVEQGTFNRDSIERAVPGLDGVLSIDLGGRSRHIRQKGQLRARSRAELNSKIDAISEYMDGRTHKLTTDKAGEFDDLRMDAFTVSEDRTSSGGVAVDYEIVYTQLGAGQ